MYGEIYCDHHLNQYQYWSQKYSTHFGVAAKIGNNTIHI